MAKEQKNISLDPTTKQQLEELEEYTTLTASALIRQYIREAYRRMLEEKKAERALMASPQ